MKLFKQVDLCISLLLIAGFTIYALVEPEYLFLGYFAVGGWQVASMLVHLIARWFTVKGSPRMIYTWVSGIVIGLAFLGKIITPLLFIFLVLLFVAPVMALVYCHICYREIKSLKEKENHSVTIK